MKKLIPLLIIFTLVVCTPAAVWKNGGTSQGVSKVKFGTHDWIFWKGYLMAKDDVDLGWLKTNVNYVF